MELLRADPLECMRLHAVRGKWSSSCEGCPPKQLTAVKFWQKNNKKPRDLKLKAEVDAARRYASPAQHKYAGSDYELGENPGPERARMEGQ